MSGIDPRMWAWLAGTKGPADSGEYRRRLAELERSAGAAAAAVRSDTAAAVAGLDGRVDTLEAAPAPNGIIQATAFMSVAGSFGTPQQFYYTHTFSGTIEVGWCIAAHQSSLAYSAPLGQYFASDYVSTAWNCFASGTLAMQFFAVLA